jgi:hypothetical protein
MIHLSMKVVKLFSLQNLVILIWLFINSFIFWFFVGFRRFSQNSIYSEGGDGLAIQAFTQFYMNYGIFDRSYNLAWPFGFNPYQEPQLGFLYPIIVKFTTIFSGSENSSFNWGVTFFMIFLLNLACGYAFYSNVSKSIGLDNSRNTALIFSSLISMSPYVMGKIAHINVASIWIIFIILNFLLFLNKKISIGKYFMVAVAIFLAPLWWTLILLLITVCYSVVRIIQNKVKIGKSILVLFVFIFPLILNYLIYINFRITTKPPTRYMGDSKIYSGYLNDFILTSPFLNTKIQQFSNLSYLSSAEYSPLGLSGLIVILLSLSLIISGRFKDGFFNKFKDLFESLNLLTIITFLFFLTGGLGVTQSFILGLFDFVTPLRAFSRLNIIILILFSCYFLLFISSLRSKRILVKYMTLNTLIILVVSLNTFDLNTIGRRPMLNKSQFEEYSAVQFIRDTFKPCPILQLPIDDIFVARVPYSNQAEIQNYMYRGIVPYLMLPNFNWSYGFYNQESIKILSYLKIQLTKSDKEIIGSFDYCGVLFDKNLSKFIQEKNIEIEGTQIIDWGVPEFENDRFSFYVTNDTRKY